MEKNQKSFRDELIVFAEIADLFDKSEILSKEKITINVSLNNEKFKSILSNFRDMDKNNESFSINFEEVNFNFSLKK